MRTSWKKGSARCDEEVITISKAVTVRLLFLIHCILALTLVVECTHEPLFWIHACSFLLLVIEGAHAIFHRGGAEHKWVSLGVLLFTCLNIVPMIIIEQKMIKLKTDLTTHNLEATTTGYRGHDSPSTDTYTNDTEFLKTHVDSVYGYIIEQTFLLLMIIGRWLLPKGQLSRSNLSNLLLILIDKACDMTDFFTLFSETSVINNSSFTRTLLIVWTLSVFQFPITVTESTKKDLNVNIKDFHFINKQYLNCVLTALNVCLKTDIWSILVSIFMQELPFLACRIVAVTHIGVVNNSIFFFLAKNSLVIAMYLYRLVSLILESRQHKTIIQPVQENLSDEISLENLNDSDEETTVSIVVCDTSDTLTRWSSKQQWTTHTNTNSSPTILFEEPLQVMAVEPDINCTANYCH